MASNWDIVAPFTAVPLKVNVSAAEGMTVGLVVPPAVVHQFVRVFHEPVVVVSQKYVAALACCDVEATMGSESAKAMLRERIVGFLAECFTAVEYIY